MRCCHSLPPVMSASSSGSVALLDDDSLAAFMSARQPRVILFSAKHSVPSMFSSAAAAHARDAVFGRVHSSSTAIMLRFGVDPAQVPRLIVVTLERTYLFKGEASAEAISHFIAQVLQHVRSSAAPASSPSPLPSSAGRASAVSWFWFRCTPRCCFRATRLTSLAGQGFRSRPTRISSPPLTTLLLLHAPLPGALHAMVCRRLARSGAVGGAARHNVDSRRVPLLPAAAPAQPNDVSRPLPQPHYFSLGR
jgi:hypothetical protein